MNDPIKREWNTPEEDKAWEYLGESPFKYLPDNIKKVNDEYKSDKKEIKVKIAAIDPGSFQSALVVLEDDDILEKMIVPNQILLNRFRAEDVQADIFVFEQMECYGKPVGKNIFETIAWTGRFIEAVDVVGSNWLEMPRREVKMWLCNSVKATDANVRRTLLDRFGDWEYGKTGKGTKAHPGRLYDFSDDMWAALAIAVTHKERMGNG